MSEKHLVVQGGTCQCKFSESPQTDKIKVLTQTKEFANDKEASKKLIATNKEIGQTLEKNSFGKCKLQPTSSGNLPCMAVISAWTGAYEKVTFEENHGNPLTEDSKATCPIGGPDCISIKDHGQKADVTKQNEKNADDKAMEIIYPFGNLKKEPTQILQIPNE
jgi:Domain of unknown function (DUF4280)